MKEVIDLARGRKKNVKAKSEVKPKETVKKSEWEQLAEKIDPVKEWGKFYAEVKKHGYWEKKEEFFEWCRKKGYI